MLAPIKRLVYISSLSRISLLCIHGTTFRRRQHHRANACLLTHDQATAVAAQPRQPSLAAQARQQHALPTREQRVIVLTGPTAVGKTAASLSLAEALGGEIISADSVQVYRGLDIGSDKIMPGERRGIAHHLIDILSPHEEFSAGDFYARARAAAADVLRRGKVPIVVGGTGFYLRWFVHGKPQTPTSTPESAQRVADMLAKTWEEEAKRRAAEQPLSAEERWELGRALVAALGDPVSAERLREVPGNWYRLNRVLEIVSVAGRPLAELDLDTAAPLDYDFRCFFLNRRRSDLYRRIDARCEQMLAGGLLQEAQWLLDSGLTPDGCCAGRAIGYRQSMAFLQRCAADPCHISAPKLVQLVAEVQRASRNLCHRQLSWFRDEPLFAWVDADRDAADVSADIVARLARGRPHQAERGSFNGRLTKEEERELKAYVTRLQLFNRQDVVQATLDSIRALVAGRVERC